MAQPIYAAHKTRQKTTDRPAQAELCPGCEHGSRFPCGRIYCKTHHGFMELNPRGEPWQNWRCKRHQPKGK